MAERSSRGLLTVRPERDSLSGRFYICNLSHRSAGNNSPRQQPGAEQQFAIMVHPDCGPIGVVSFAPKRLQSGRFAGVFAGVGSYVEIENRKSKIENRSRS